MDSPIFRRKQRPRPASTTSSRSRTPFHRHSAGRMPAPGRLPALCELRSPVGLRARPVCVSLCGSSDHCVVGFEEARSRRGASAVSPPARMSPPASPGPAELGPAWVVRELSGSDGDGCPVDALALLPPCIAHPSGAVAGRARRRRRGRGRRRRVRAPSRAGRRPRPRHRPRDSPPDPPHVLAQRRRVSRRESRPGGRRGGRRRRLRGARLPRRRGRVRIPRIVRVPRRVERRVPGPRRRHPRRTAAPPTARTGPLL